MTAQGSEAALAAELREALDFLPKTCRYHGDKLDRDGMWGPACCETGRPALARRNALAALERVAAAEGEKAEACGGLDPYYPGTCPMPKGHSGGCFNDPETDA